MNDESFIPVKSDFITALRIIYHEGLSDAFAHFSARSIDGNEMMFMPRKSPALVTTRRVVFVDFDKPCRSLLAPGDLQGATRCQSDLPFSFAGGGAAERRRSNHSADAQLQRDLSPRRPLYTGTGRSSRRPGRGHGQLLAMPRR